MPAPASCAFWPTANTGSGNIYAEQTGTGDVKAQTGSGNVELRNLHGGLRAGTGSGDIKAGGVPSADWKLETGSGGVGLHSGIVPARSSMESPAPRNS